MISAPHTEADVPVQMANAMEDYSAAEEGLNGSSAV